MFRFQPPEKTFSLTLQFRKSQVPREEVVGALQAAARIAPRLKGGSVYTDDKAPVEWLIDASIVEVAAEGER